METSAQASSAALSTRPPKLLDQIRARIRRRNFSIRTEQAYVDWARRFILFHGKRHPREMGAAEVEAFLSHLAVERVSLAPADDPASAPAGVEAYRLYGSLFFGSVGKLEALTDPAHFAATQAPQVIVLDFAPLLSLDTTGVEALDTLRRQLARHHGTLLIAGATEQPLSLLTRSGFVERNGAENFSRDFAGALVKAWQALAKHDSGAR